MIHILGRCKVLQSFLSPTFTQECFEKLISHNWDYSSLKFSRFWHNLSIGLVLLCILRKVETSLKIHKVMKIYRVLRVDLGSCNQCTLLLKWCISDTCEDCQFAITSQKKLLKLLILLADRDKYQCRGTIVPFWILRTVIPNIDCLICWTDLWHKDLTARNSVELANRDVRVCVRGLNFVVLLHVSHFETTFFKHLGSIHPLQE